MGLLEESVKIREKQVFNVEIEDGRRAKLEYVPGGTFCVL